MCLRIEWTARDADGTRSSSTLIRWTSSCGETRYLHVLIVGQKNENSRDFGNNRLRVTTDTRVTSATETVKISSVPEVKGTDVCLVLCFLDIP